MHAAGGGPARSGSGGAGQSGQATVELALCLPILVVVLAMLVEAGMVIGDQSRLWLAAREAARAAVVDAQPSAALAAARSTGLADVTMRVRPEPAYRAQGRPLTVSLGYRPSGHVPIVGALFSALELHAQATMRIEQP
jgi:hypothetical protein